MKTPKAANTTSKKPSSVTETGGDKATSKVQKRKIPGSHAKSLEGTNKDGRRSPAYYRALVEEFNNRQSLFPEPDEQQEIMDELEAKSHILLLEYNTVSNAKCRAFDCQKQQDTGDERIRDRYRLLLQAAQPSNLHWTEKDTPDRRFYHVNCFESIGVDIAKYLTLPPEHVFERVGMMGVISRTTCTFHSAIRDWVTNKGKAFDVEQYSDYEKEVRSYQRKSGTELHIHMMFCKDPSCVHAVSMARPVSSDFIDGEPQKRSLARLIDDVLRYRKEHGDEQEMETEREKARRDNEEIEEML